MIIESGIIIFVGLLLLAIKLPLRMVLRLLGYPFAVDITASILAYALHQGSFTGMMAAAVSGLLTSAMTSAARYSIGYISNKKYYPGKIWNLTANLQGDEH